MFKQVSKLLVIESLTILLFSAAGGTAAYHLVSWLGWHLGHTQGNF